VAVECEARGAQSNLPAEQSEEPDMPERMASVYSDGDAELRIERFAYSVGDDIDEEALNARLIAFGPNSSPNLDVPGQQQQLVQDSMPQDSMTDLARGGTTGHTDWSARLIGFGPDAPPPFILSDKYALVQDRTVDSIREERYVESASWDRSFDSGLVDERMNRLVGMPSEELGYGLLPSEVTGDSGSCGNGMEQP